MSVLSILNSVLLSYLFAEGVRVIFFTKEWKYRFNIDSMPLENWKKGIVLMGMFILAFPLINWIFIRYISVLLGSLGYYQFQLLLVLLVGVYLWIEKRILSTPWSKIDIIPISIIVLIILLTIIF